MKKYRIALIDDNEGDMKLLCKALNETDQFEVRHTFMNGADFLSFLANNSIEADIDIAVIDFQMPILNGLETIRNLISQQVPFKLLLVSHGYYGNAMKGLSDIGTQNYCAKTPEMIELCATKLLEGRMVYDTIHPIVEWEGTSKVSSLHLKDESYWRNLISPLDKKIIKLICLGLSSNEIAPILGYETSSIEKYRGAILKSLNLKNSHQLAAWAFITGLISPTFVYYNQNQFLSSQSVSLEDNGLIENCREYFFSLSPRKKVKPKRRKKRKWN
ncbi:MAG: hypothetical protein CFE21_00120 [Bacteroidetes bacterium B1(2017)]|nr:MAG: hypothetical protein CFE21_00120 [Bacteroidetes bacterium B1(2017)]